MKTVEYEYGKPLSLSPSVLALGFFDGVTVAHRELIKEAKKEAEARGLSLGVFTFPSEDRLKPGADRIYSTEEKLILLERCGVDFAVLGDFSALSGLSPESFVSDVIIGDIGAECAASGFNFRFGKSAKGTARDLARLMELGGRECITVRELTMNGLTVSATRIRGFLATNDIERANELLGAPYFIKGRVSSGNGKGAELGFPTVNTSIENKRVTPVGVFRSAVPVGDKIYHALTNIGTCPTLGEREIHAETHILGYEGNLYGKDVEIYLLGHLREERKFGSADELCRQVEEDKQRTIKENGELTWQRLGLK